MEKGKIKIKKNPNSQAEITTKDGKFKVRKDFDFSSFRDLENNIIIDCEYEFDKEKNQFTKILINGKIVPFNEKKLEEKKKQQKKREQKKLTEEKLKKEEEENKKIIDFMKNDFAKAEKAFLPSDTFDALQGNEGKIDNFALRLNKLARFEEDEKNFLKSKFQFYKTDRNKIVYEPKVKFDDNFIKEIQNSYSKIFESLLGKQNTISFPLKINWRLIVGLGHESVYETSITLHHIYGIPYIPASAIKGILRSWIIAEYFNSNECEALIESLEFCKIFGAPAECEKKDKSKAKTAIYKEFKKQDKNIDAYMGDIVFFDAFPTKPPTVEVDIMNPHYPDYYQDDTGKTPPADWQNPVPIFFLTVKDTSFQFLFGIRKGKENFDVEFGGNKGKVLKVLSDILKEALSTRGIGAKTAVGYGRMK